MLTCVKLPSVEKGHFTLSLDRFEYAVLLFNSVSVKTKWQCIVYFAFKYKFTLCTGLVKYIHHCIIHTTRRGKQAYSTHLILYVPKLYRKTKTHLPSWQRLVSNNIIRTKRLGKNYKNKSRRELISYLSLQQKYEQLKLKKNKNNWI